MGKARPRISAANIELQRRIMAAYDAGDVEAFAACLTDDWTASGPSGETATLDDMSRLMELHRTGFPDKHTEIVRIVADDDLVACYCIITAIHTGTYFDSEPTGKKITVNEMIFNTIRDGKISATLSITSSAGLYEQLTGKPAPL